MNQDDPFDSFLRESQKLSEEWHAAYARYGNAHSALQGTLTLLGTNDPRIQATHGQIAWAKQALGELQQIQERMKAALDRVDKAVS